MAASQDDLVTATKNLVIATNALVQVMKQVLPYTQSVATSATAGTHGAVPAQVVGYLSLTNPVDGTAIKVPFFAT